MSGRVRAGAVGTTAAAGLVLGGVAAAYWTDTGTLTSGAVNVASVAPFALASCLDPGGGSLAFGEDPTLRWNAPAGMPVQSYEISFTLTSDGGITMVDPDWDTGPTYVRGPNSPGTLVTTVPGTQTQASWGITVNPPGTLQPNRQFTGTVTVVAIGPGGWRSNADTASWQITYNATIIGLPLGGSISCTV